MIPRSEAGTFISSATAFDPCAIAASALTPAAAVNPTACKNSRRLMLVLPLLPSNYQRRYDGGRYLLTVDLTARSVKVPMSLFRLMKRAGTSAATVAVGGTADEGHMRQRAGLAIQ